MTKRIFRSILWACLLVLLASGVMTVWTVYNSFVSEQTRALQNEADLIAWLLNTQSDPDLEIEDLKNLQTPEMRLSLIASDGQVLYDSNRPGIEANHGNREEIIQGRESGKGFSIRYSDTISEETYNAAVRLKNGAFIRLSSSHSSLISLLGQALLPLAITVPVLIGLVWIMAKLLTRHIVDPINAINLTNPLDSCPYEQLKPLLERLDANNRQIQKQMDQINWRSKEFETLSENMDEGLIIVSSDETVLTMNTAASEIFGPQASPAARKKLKKLIRTALNQKPLKDRLKLDGRVYSLGAAPIEDERHVIGAMVLALDITEKQEATKRRQEFTANVTHELKTPLQTIISSAELLNSGLVRPEDLPRFSGYILDEARRMSAMINDIIRLSRLENEGEQVTGRVNVREVIEKTVDKFASDAALHSIRVDVDAQNVIMYADENNVVDIVKNLLENAIRYNRENGTIHITLRKENHQAVLQVEDTGQGIPPDSIDRIFERFYTSDPSRKTRGTGLGLAIVSHAVKKLNGTIEVKSQLGEGSSFTVRLPLRPYERVTTNQLTK